MRLKPVLAPARIGYERHLQRVGVLHFFYYDLLNKLFLLWQNREVEFVVNLQNHLRTDTLAAEALVDAHHRYLYDVGGRALYRCVDGVALGEVAHGGVVRSDVGQVAAAVEERLGVAWSRANCFAFSMYSCTPGNVLK